MTAMVLGKKTLLFSLFLLALTSASLAQKTSDILSLRLGYSSTNIIFKEAYVPSASIFGQNFNPGNTFSADGPQLGISKDISDKLYLDLAISPFSGRDTKLIVNSYENFYKLKGFQLPLTVNYLLRDPGRRLRVNIGAGVQYLNARLQQFETTGVYGAQTTSLAKEINISELQLSLRPGLQFRIVPRLFVSFIVNVSFSANGRYADNPCFALKYTIKKKR